MRELEARPDDVIFPSRCMVCGGSPETEIVLEAWRGIDLLYVRWGRYCEVSMPACKRCRRRRLAHRLLWVVAAIGALVGFLAVGALASQELPKGMQGFVLAPLMLLGVAYLIYMRSREREHFQRWFLPVWLFHATTAYDILRSRGVNVGKSDYLGALRMKG